MTTTELLTDTPKSPAPRAWLLLAHGAGAPMTSPFMNTMVSLLTERNIAVTRFEFAYMAARRDDGKRRPPPKAELLVPEFEAAVAAVAALPARAGIPLLIGGKSMGGRIATLCADRLFGRRIISGAAVLGFPFHPPGKPDRLRTAHLENLRCPLLIVQGERDPFGCRDEVDRLTLSPAIHFAWAADGDHDLGPRASSGTTRKANLATAADAVAAFTEDLS